MDFSTTRTVKGKQLAYRYDVADHRIKNNDHTLQATPQGEVQTIVINGKTCTLKQFHFHVPSEHTLKSKHSSMEAHFVHQVESGTPVVIGSVLKPGKNNLALSALTAKKLGAGESVTLKNLNARALLSKDSKSFQLKGPLTAPPYSENVIWVVLGTPVQADVAQFKIVRNIIDGKNNRPVQPLNDCKINKDK